MEEVGAMFHPGVPGGRHENLEERIQHQLERRRELRRGFGTDPVSAVLGIVWALVFGVANALVRALKFLVLTVEKGRAHNKGRRG
jgi:hypothetical protein